MVSSTLVSDYNISRGVKENLKKPDLNKSDWKNDAIDQNKWRGAVKIACNVWEGNGKMIQHSELKRVCCKGTIRTAINTEH